MYLIKRTALMIAVLSLSLVGCGNNTDNPNTDPQASEITSTSSLSYTGKSDGADISIIIADNYLNKVLKGNPYGTDAAVTPCDATFDKADVKIQGLSYYGGNSIDITCDKQHPDNEFTLLPMGSDPNGAFGYYTLCANSAYYFIEFPITSFPPILIAQSEHHEITNLLLSGSKVFNCDGSDGNEYEVTFYSTYKPSSLAIEADFNTRTNVFTGVVGVNLKNDNDNEIQLFFE